MLSGQPGKPEIGSFFRIRCPLCILSVVLLEHVKKSLHNPDRNLIRPTFNESISIGFFDGAETGGRC